MKPDVIGLQICFLHAFAKRRGNMHLSFIICQMWTKLIRYYLLISNDMC